MFLMATLRFKVRVKMLHTVNVTVHLLLEINLFINKNSKNNCMRNIFFWTCLTLLHPEYCVSDNPGHGTS